MTADRDFATPRKAAEAPADTRFAALLDSDVPVIARGLASDWPLVGAGGEGPAALSAYLKRFDAGRDVTVYAGAPEIGGRFFYNETLTGLNFTAARAPLAAMLDRLVEGTQQESLYIGSTDLDAFLPGLRAETPLPDDEDRFAALPLASIWIGNRTTAATHFDMSNNIAVCAAGRRRFTLFPPDQVGNLYPGPVEPTPGGQVVSMVDLNTPDFARYPRFAEALRHAVIAELEPGDVLVYPALWWHNVEALDAFNVLVNFWWNAVPGFVDTPWNTLLHGLLSLRDRPAREKEAWRALFDHYVLGPADTAGAHLPVHARGPLAPLDDSGARRLRAYLQNRLNR